MIDSTKSPVKAHSIYLHGITWDFVKEDDLAPIRANQKRPFLMNVFVFVCVCIQAIAHYEQAADYYKGEESNRWAVHHDDL